MEVILLERVEKLGQMGQVVSVKPGFARNYLLPRKKATRATKSAIEQFENQRVQFEADNLKHKAEAEQIAAKMHGLIVSLIRQAGESGHLYGSASSRDIAEAVTKKGFSVSRQQVVLDTPIKTLGFHQARVNIHPEVSVNVTVNIALTEEEAQLQAAKAKAASQAVEAPEA